MSDQSLVSDVLADPAQAAPTTTERGPKWIAPVVIAALVVGLAGVGVGAYAVATMPAKTSGPQGPVGPRGATGNQGPQGAKGATGGAGPAGTLAATTVVKGTPVKTALNPAVGTVLVAKTSCPAGHILVSGGAQVSAPGIQGDRNVELRSSFPTSATEWQTVAIVTGSLGAGGAMTMSPYVMCGVATPTSTSTTTPSQTSTSV